MKSETHAPRVTTVRLLLLAMVASLLFPALLFAYASWVNYRLAQAEVDERIERSLDVLHEQALKVFQSIDLALENVTDMLGTMSDAEIVANAPRLRDRVIRIVDTLSEVQSIWVFDQKGYPLITTYGDAPISSVSFADRDYFHEHVTRHIDTYVGQILISRINGRPFFGVSRRRETADGDFAGVIEVSIVPTDFYRFYEHIARSAGFRYAMLRDDGSFLALYPMPITGPLKLNETSGFRREIVGHPQGGLYTTASQIDGIERRIGIRKLEGYPIYLNVSIDTSVARNEWLATMGSHLIFGIPATALLFVTIGVVLQRTRRLYAEADRRQAAEDALRQSQKMEAIGQLTGGVAHDFNNLLTVISGNLEIAQRTVEGWTEGSLDRLRRVITNARHGADRAATLTRSLLAFARRQQLDPRPLDVNKLIAGVSDLLRRSLGERVALEVVGAGGLWRVEADPSQLETAILNLALNARDAMPEGGKLTIETSNAFLDDDYCRHHSDVSPGQYVQIAVTDAGIGMSREVMERVFEPFFTTKEAGQGTGLGLSQVYGFVKQSGGHLKIYSEPGEGTTVKIYLPRRIAEVRDELEPQRETPSSDSGETILVVEDDADVREYVVESLRDLNYRVIEAAEAGVALELLGRRGERVDLLLTDVVLPGVNGPKLAEQAKQRQPGIKVLFMTGYSRNAIVHQGRLDDGVDLIQKPLTQAALGARVRGVLDGSAGERRA